MDNYTQTIQKPSRNAPEGAKTMLQPSLLHPYQRRAIKFILAHPFCGLFLEMGLGKTISTLSALRVLIDRGQARRVLLIAPKRVAQKTWTNEVEQWSHVCTLRLSLVLGSKKEREEALATDADIYVINRENVVWLFDHLKGRCPFDTLVIDELSSFKAYNTKRFKALKKVRPQFKRVIGLTGTPSPNSLLDLWAQLYLIDGGERLGQYITHYRSQYFIPGRGSGHVVYEWILRPGAEEEIQRRISDICMSMRAEDYLDLPPVQYVRVPVGLTPKERKEYRSFQREQVAIFSDGTTITAQSAGVLIGKLQQWTSGALYREDHTTIETTRAKEERLQEMMEGLDGTPVLIAYHYRFELERLRALFPTARTIDEPGVFDAWNRGEVPILLGHPASMGHGLNLQRGGHVIIWYTLTWSLELYQQMNARLARQGQTAPVTIYHLIAEGTVDERAMKVLEGKATTQDALMEVLRDGYAVR